MLPYQAVAMDYTGYQRQTQHHHTGMPPVSAAGHMGHMAGALGIAGPSPFAAHSWLMPTQDMCGTSAYGKQMPGGQGAVGGLGAAGGPGAMQQPQDPGCVKLLDLNNLSSNCKLASNWDHTLSITHIERPFKAV